MEVDEIQTSQQASKYSRVNNSNGRIDTTSKVTTASEDNNTGGGGGGGGANNTCRAVVPATTTTAMTVNGGDMGVGSSSTRFGRQWQHSSRIIRVSRASGGKDRHSKVWTAKGPRDRRVRLSVTTAIQFYDLQDRLGYDQPSKAVEWLIKAAADAINELPSLNTANFPPETTRQLSDDRRVTTNVVDSGDMDLDGGSNQQQMGSKSGCSSNNSDTSKGSGSLSLSQKEIRNKARERARERTAKEKERDDVNVGSQNVGQTSSFTQLLTGRIDNTNAGSSSNPSPHHQWLPSGSGTTSSMADYFESGLMSLSSSRLGQLGNHPPQVMTLASFGGSENQHHEQLQHFPFVSEHNHLIQVANATANGSGNDYNLNFTMSSSSTATPSLNAGFNNRGTLQSNSPSLVMPYLQRFSADGSGLPFFLGSAAPVSSASPTVENHHHHQQFQTPGLQLCYAADNGVRQTDHKGKGKN